MTFVTMAVLSGAFIDLRIKLKVQSKSPVFLCFCDVQKSNCKLTLLLVGKVPYWKLQYGLDFMLSIIKQIDLKVKLAFLYDFWAQL